MHYNNYNQDNYNQANDNSASITQGTTFTSLHQKKISKLTNVVDASVDTNVGNNVYGNLDNNKIEGFSNNTQSGAYGGAYGSNFNNPVAIKNISEANIVSKNNMDLDKNKSVWKNTRDKLINAVESIFKPNPFAGKNIILFQTNSDPGYGGYVTMDGVFKFYVNGENIRNVQGKNGCPVENWIYVFKGVTNGGAMGNALKEGSIIKTEPTLTVGQPMKSGDICTSKTISPYANQIVRLYSQGFIGYVTNNNEFKYYSTWDVIRNTSGKKGCAKAVTDANNMPWLLKNVVQPISNNVITPGYIIQLNPPLTVALPMASGEDCNKSILMSRFANKNVRINNGYIGYVTDKGIWRVYTSWDIYAKTAGKNGCPPILGWDEAYTSVAGQIPCCSIVPTLGSILTTNPQLTVGPPMVYGENCTKQIMGLNLDESSKIKVGYIENNNLLREYPSELLEGGTEYYSLGNWNNPTGTIRTNTASSLVECQKICNNDKSCTGVEYQDQTSKCHIKNTTLKPDTDRIVDPTSTLYIRGKKFNGISCGTNIETIDKTKWNSYKDGDYVNANIRCGGGTEINKYISDEKIKLQQSNDKINTSLNQIESSFKKLSKEEKVLKDKTSVYTVANNIKDYNDTQHMRNNISDKMVNLDAMETDTMLTMVSENYNYLFWSILANILIIIGIKSSRS